MNDYLSNTPIYKIWCDFISVSSQENSTLITDHKFRFNEIRCNQDFIKTSYDKDNSATTIEIVLFISDRLLLCNYSSTLQSFTIRQNLLDYNDTGSTNSDLLRGPYAKILTELTERLK